MPPRQRRLDSAIARMIIVPPTGFDVPLGCQTAYSTDPGKPPDVCLLFVSLAKPAITCLRKKEADVRQRSLRRFAL